MSFLLDFVNFIIYKIKEKKFTIGFLCENKKILPYISDFIIGKKKNLVVISFEKLIPIHNKKENIYYLVLKTKFFQELFFLTLKIKYLYSSTPDLDNSYFRKSKFSKCKYIYLQHSPVSLTMVYDTDAFKNFDAIQAINKNQFLEIQEMKKRFNKNIKGFKSEYKFMKNFIIHKIEKKVDVLIAPTWNSSFYRLNLHINLVKLLNKSHLTYHFRPHYMSFTKNEISKDYFLRNKIILNLDDNLNFSFYNNLITDWSGIFLEFAYHNKKKVYLINTPKKVRNENYTDFGIIPIEISSRNILAKEFETNGIELLVNEISKDNSNNEGDEKQINAFFQDNFFFI